jgi:hypothetical protein
MASSLTTVSGSYSIGKAQSAFLATSGAMPRGIRPVRAKHQGRRMTCPYGSRRGAEACPTNELKKVRRGGLRGRPQEKVVAWIPVRPRSPSARTRQPARLVPGRA